MANRSAVKSAPPTTKLWFSFMMLLLRTVRRFSRRVLRQPEVMRFGTLAWLSAPVIELALATAGLERTLRAVETLTPGRKTRPAALNVSEAESVVSVAFRLHPALGGQCLPRALVQYGLHRLDGVHARFVVGVRRRDEGQVGAHAWVEAPTNSAATDFHPLLVTELAP